MLAKYGYSGHEFVSQVVLSRLSGSACHREHGLDFIRFAAVDHGPAAFVVKRVDDHFEFSVAIQIKHCSDVVYIRSNRLIQFRVNFTSYNFRLNIPVDYASQDHDGITSTLGNVQWRLRERRRG